MRQTAAAGGNEAGVERKKSETWFKGKDTGKFNIVFVIGAGLAIALSVWGPEALAAYKDRELLDIIHTEEMESAGEGYRYTLNANEKLYILSQCLNSQALPENQKSQQGLGYGELGGAYAFVVNHNGPSGQEITDEQIYETANIGLAELKELGILPDAVKDVTQESHEAALFSAIDVLEPRNNVAVWKVSLSDSQRNADKANRLIDAYLDADEGKFYEFYVRTPLKWEDIEPDEVARKWSSYMGLSEPQPYEPDNPLLEITPYFKKYAYSGMGEEQTVMTIGFYEGINELFLKISK